ncbi:ABC transporter permease [Ketobacter sp. MCCC 1A13808]|uniref:ABC transporter permease n=1 Tax=Ketobacter sp. MCCC 1A13808 TaxID=2602738 RepID=UPI0012EC81A2|nr:ABC transporter permease [Ketobacter sp. MCCC 1A13808]MVF13763.1 ABC transporter permease [Ketobacter sp. MCCC 1A13808]
MPDLDLKQPAQPADLSSQLTNLEHNNYDDMWVGLRATRVWGTLGWHDIKQRYRRSSIGPFWFTLSTAIMATVLGFLYSSLFNADIATFLPYVATGLVIWQYIGAVMTEGCNVYMTSGYLIKQVRLPLTVHVTRMVWRNFVIFFHSLPVVLLMLIALKHWPGVEGFLAIPAILALPLHGVWIATVIGILCARFRDIPPIITNLVQVSFFFTPIFWMPEVLTDRAWLVEFNPFYHVIELIRAPLLGRPLHPESWIWSLGMMAAGYLLAWRLMYKYRDRVPYWL